MINPLTPKTQHQNKPAQPKFLLVDRLIQRDMTRGYLVELLSIEAFYGPGLTVEEAVKLEKHERFLEDTEAALISYEQECVNQELGDDERFNPDIMDQKLINAGIYPSYDECGVRDDVLDAFGV